MSRQRPCLLFSLALPSCVVLAACQTDWEVRDGTGSKDGGTSTSTEHVTADHPGTDAGTLGVADAGLGSPGSTGSVLSPNLGSGQPTDAGMQTVGDPQTVIGQPSHDRGAADSSTPPMKALECQPGAKRCDTAQDFSTCTERGWGAAAPCPFVCAGAGECVGECMAGQTRCSEGGTAQTCSAAGRWGDGGTHTCTKPNLALGATVIYSTSLTYAVFSAPGLVDGDVNTAYSSELETSPDGSRMTKDRLCADWVGVQMSKNVTFSTVVLVPRSDGVNFPQAFSIDLWDGEKWIPRLTVNPPNGGLYKPSGPLPYSWGHSDTTTQVRICATVLAQEDTSYAMQLAELQLLP